MYAGQFGRNKAFLFFPYHDNDQTATGGFFHERQRRLACMTRLDWTVEPTLPTYPRLVWKKKKDPRG